MSRPEHQIGNSQLISAVNSRLVLQAIRALQPTYRAEVARHTRLTPATVTGIVNGLLDHDLLTATPEYGATTPRGGRPPQILNVNAGARYVLAVDLEPDVLRVALTDLLVNIIEFREQAVDRFAEPDGTCRTLLRLCTEVLGEASTTKLLGAGLSLPGVVDTTEGILISSTNMPRWHNVPIRALLEQRLSLPVKVGRSTHLAALHEEWIRPLEPDRIVLLISLRTGIGMCLMTHGEVYVGGLGFDGEIGHTVVEIDGSPCECGNRGCLETFVSASAVCERAEAMMRLRRGRALRACLDQGEILRPELVYRLAKRGDADCAEIVRDVGRYIGIAAANMINLFAPHEVVLCGSIDTADEIILDVVKRQVEAHSLPKSRERLTIRLAEAKEKAPLLGAAVLVAQEIFELPKLTYAASHA